MPEEPSLSAADQELADRYAGEHLANELDARLAAGDAKVDEQAGSLDADGRHVLRSGSLVVVTTWDSRRAIDHDTVKGAKQAFEDAAP